jgi:alcohol dehydrogenase class IV
MRFEFSTATRVVFGQGVVQELAALAKPFCEPAGRKRAMIVTGKDKIRHAGIINGLEGAGFTCNLFGVSGEPTVAVVREGAELLRAVAPGVVIAIGGGSAIDAGKAIAALGANPGDVLDYLEVVGQGRPFPHAPVPFIAVPTTAGTGSEVTRNAVLGSPEHGVKASLRSPLMLPAIALVDPELTLGLPRAITAATGLDALTQLIEPLVSIRANPLTDALCRDGLATLARSLPRACANGRDTEARIGMSYASLLGGLALANAGLGVVHGLAAPVGGMFPAPHGAVCAALLPAGMAANIRALRERAPESASLVRYGEVARILTGQPRATAEEGVEWVRLFVAGLSVPPLRSYGITGAHTSALAEKAERAGSMKANPLPLTRQELCAVLEAAV